MKEKLRNGFLLFLLVAILGYLAGSAVFDLVNTKTSKNWRTKNFSENEGSVQIIGLVKRIIDFDTEKELESRLLELEGVNFPNGVGCMIINYLPKAIIQLIDSFVLAGVFFTGKYIFKREVNPILTKGWLIVMIAALVVMIELIR